MQHTSPVHMNRNNMRTASGRAFTLAVYAHTQTPCILKYMCNVLFACYKQHALEIQGEYSRSLCIRHCSQHRVPIIICALVAVLVSTSILGCNLHVLWNCILFIDNDGIVDDYAHVMETRTRNWTYLDCTVIFGWKCVCWITRQIPLLAIAQYSCGMWCDLVLLNVSVSIEKTVITGPFPG